METNYRVGNKTSRGNVARTAAVAGLVALAGGCATQGQGTEGRTKTSWINYDPFPQGERCNVGLINGNQKVDDAISWGTYLSIVAD